MAIEDKTKRLLLGQPPACTHAGWIVPVLSMVQTIPMPEDPNAPPPTPKKKTIFGKETEADPVIPSVITFVRTVEALCVKCNLVIKFGQQPAPKADETEAQAKV